MAQNKPLISSIEEARGRAFNPEIEAKGIVSVLHGVSHAHDAAQDRGRKADVRRVVVLIGLRPGQDQIQ